MVPSESVPRELSNEWSCRYVLTTLNFLGYFCVLSLVTPSGVKELKVQSTCPVQIQPPPPNLGSGWTAPHCQLLQERGSVSPVSRFTQSIKQKQLLFSLVQRNILKWYEVGLSKSRPGNINPLSPTSGLLPTLAPNGLTWHHHIPCSSGLESI
jgi:hypothetical protein